jgi:ABC-type transport system substrate-binding protein
MEVNSSVAGRCQISFRSVVLFSVLGFGAASICLLESSRAQKPAGKPPLEEIDKTRKPLGKPPRDEDPDSPKLSLDSEDNGHPDLKNLYRGLEVPHDEVTLVGEAGPLAVMLIPNWLGAGATFQGTIELKIYDDQWKLRNGKSVLSRNIQSVNYFEQIALAEVDKFLRSSRAAPLPGNSKTLSRQERYDAAEKVLEAVVFAPARRVRTGYQWKSLDRRLKEKLLDIRKDHLLFLVNDLDWDKALVLATTMAQKYSSDAAVQKEVAQNLAQLVERPLKEERYEEVQKRLAALEDLPSSAGVAEPIRQRLHSKAAKFFQLAQEAQDNKDRVKANEMIIRAGKLWPRLEGLRDFRGRLNKDHPTLGVGVRELPENFSPAAAVTDSERQAVELLFDSLLKLKDRRDSEAGGTQFYEPGLAVTQPLLTSRGRLFQLDRNADWSNGDRVMEADVRMTVQLLRQPDWNGFDPAWANLVESALPGHDMHQVYIGLRQGCFDPLALLTFKILPTSANLTRPDDKNFARHPVCSGPFQLPDRVRQDWDSHGGRVVFVANSGYHRSHLAGVPQIQEIHFFKSESPVDDFKDGSLHLLLDVTPQRLRDIQDESKGLTGQVSIQTLPNRRIYFLAVNHRIRSLQNEQLRKAVAHAINRNQILDDVFRGDQKSILRSVHRPLTGPFPAGSWACKPNLETRLAAGLETQVKGLGNPGKLSLKYPSDDPLVKEACVKIQEQVRSATGIQLDLEPRSPHQLHHEVEVDQNYELAYYSYDYASTAYWLWPLFNTHPRALAPGGRNYLGYHNDGELESAFQNAMAHREFPLLQLAMHNIHEQFYQKMPFIPLWQLDTVVAVHKDLVAPNLDSLVIFSDVDKWQLMKK